MKRGRSKSAPKYRLHKATGQARVTINGKTFYLGKYDSAESHQRYRQALSDHWAVEGAIPKQNVNESDSQVTIARLAIEFAKYSLKKHGKNSQEWMYQVKPVLKKFRADFGHLSPNEFGPKHFENYRQSLVEKGYCRDVVLDRISYLHLSYTTTCIPLLRKKSRLLNE